MINVSLIIPQHWIVPTEQGDHANVRKFTKNCLGAEYPYLGIFRDFTCRPYCMFKLLTRHCPLRAPLANGFVP